MHIPKLQLYLLTKKQISLVLQTGTVRVWIAVASLLVITLILGARVERFDNGVIWFVFGKEIPSFNEFFLPFSVSFFLWLGVGLFFPVGLAASVQALFEGPIVNYYLARPIPRSSIIYGNILGVSIAYGFLIGIFVALIWLVGAIKMGIAFMPKILTSILFMPVGVGVYALLVVGVLAARSLGIGLMLHLVYNFFIAHYMLNRTPGIAWWEKIINIVLEAINYLLPPLAAMYNLVKPTNHSALQPMEIILNSACSIFFLSFIAVMLYRRMEF